MQSLIDQLIEEGYLKTPRTIEAFRAIDRADFMPQNMRDEAYLNAALPIGYNQTISQPLTVAFMLELLDPTEGANVLDIGAGSGWQTALLAHIVGPKGQVFAVEIVPELYEFAQVNVKKYDFQNVKFYQEDASTGLPQESPYDCIIAAASAPEIPEEYKKQLKPGGRLILPIGGFSQKIVKITSVIPDSDRESKTTPKFTQEDYPGFVFVPMRGEKGFET